MSTTDERGWMELEERAQQNEREVWAGLEDAREVERVSWYRCAEADWLEARAER